LITYDFVYVHLNIHPQLYSEELINLCLSTMKNLLSKVIYPFVESPSADPREIPHLLQHVLNKHTTKPSQTFDVAPHRSLLKELFQALSSALPRVTGLIGAEAVAMSDTIIIQAVYIAIGPFFIVEASEGDAKGKKDGGASQLIHGVLGSSAMRGLRLDALSLVRSVSVIFGYSGNK
jgi:cohesin loading factor subunit SCC2